MVEKTIIILKKRGIERKNQEIPKITSDKLFHIFDLKLKRWNVVIIDWIKYHFNWKDKLYIDKNAKKSADLQWKKYKDVICLPDKVWEKFTVKKEREKKIRWWNNVYISDEMNNQGWELYDENLQNLELDKSIDELVKSFPRELEWKSESYGELFYRYEGKKESDKFASWVLKEFLSKFNDEEKAYIAESLIKKWYSYFVHLNIEGFWKIFNEKLSSVEDVKLSDAVKFEIESSKISMSTTADDIDYFMNKKWFYERKIEKKKMDMDQFKEKIFLFVASASMFIHNSWDFIRSLWDNGEQNYRTYRVILDSYKDEEKIESSFKHLMEKFVGVLSDKEKDSVAKYLIENKCGYYVYLVKETFWSKYIKMKKEEKKWVLNVRRRIIWFLKM